MYITPYISRSLFVSKNILCLNNNQQTKKNLIQISIYLIIFLGGNNNNNNSINASSEYVRQELRNIVSGRTQQSGGNIRPPQSPLGLGQGSMVGNNNNNNNNSMNNMLGSQTNQQQQQMPGTPILNTPPDHAMGFSFDISGGK